MTIFELSEHLETIPEKFRFENSIQKRNLTVYVSFMTTIPNVVTLWNILKKHLT